MCKGLEDPTGAPRRCIAHSPEVRAANRAAAKLPELRSGLLERLAIHADELAAEKPLSPEAADAAVSKWLILWREVVRALAETVVALREKQERAAAVRIRHNNARLEAIVDEQHREIAQHATRKHEEATIALEQARERLQNAELLKSLDDAAAAFSTPHELTALAEADAADELLRAHQEAEELFDALTPADSVPRVGGPRHGRGTAAHEAYLAARRREAFWRSTHEAIAVRLKATPTAEQNTEEMAAAVEAVRAGEEFLITTRKSRDAAIATAMARDRAAAEQAATEQEDNQDTGNTQLPQAA